MKTLQEFRQSKQLVSKKYLDVTFGIECETPTAYVYDDELIIEILPDDKFYLIIDRSHYITADLALLEEIAWDDFVKHENLLTPYEIEVDLQMRASDLLDELGLNISLDEVELDSLDVEQSDKVINLLEQFYK